MTDKSKPQPKKTCKFCDAKVVTVKDANGKAVGKEVQHNHAVPHPTLFGINQASKYFG